MSYLKKASNLKYLLPDLEVMRRDNIDDYEFEDIVLRDYESNPVIKARMIA